MSSILQPGDVIWDEVALRNLLAGPQGPVARDLAKRAQRVTDQAKVNASGRPGPNVDTGRLRSSISWRLGEDPEGIYADVGTGVPYGRILELGLTRNGARYPFLVPALQMARV